MCSLNWKERRSPNWFNSLYWHFNISN